MTPQQFEVLARRSLRAAWRLAILVIGGTVVLIGLAMVVLPGPAFVVIPAGLGILATEFVWARRLLYRMRDSAQMAAATFRRNAAEKPKPQPKEPTP
jgi:uncharacterized protein (TIGR02611 family)